MPSPSKSRVARRSRRRDRPARLRATARTYASRSARSSATPVMPCRRAAPRCARVPASLASKNWNVPSLPFATATRSKASVPSRSPRAHRRRALRRRSANVAHSSSDAPSKHRQTRRTDRRERCPGPRRARAPNRPRAGRVRRRDPRARPGSRAEIHGRDTEVAHRESPRDRLRVRARSSVNRAHSVRRAARCRRRASRAARRPGRSAHSDSTL